MYHIKSDKRSLNSANRIYQSLRHCLFKKNLKDITITDIYNECGISRMTFYRLFDNINDVLDYKLNYFFIEYNTLKAFENDKLLFFFTYWNKHRDLINILNKEAFSILIEAFNKKDNSTYNSYENYLKAGILASILTNWSIRNGKETPEEMKEIAKKLFSRNIDLMIDL